MKYPDFTKPKSIFNDRLSNRGLNNILIQEDGFCIFESCSMGGRTYGYLNDTLICGSANPITSYHNGDCNFVPVKKGDVISVKHYDSGLGYLNVIYYPFKR